MRHVKKETVDLKKYLEKLQNFTRQCYLAFNFHKIDQN